MAVVARGKAGYETYIAGYGANGQPIIGTRKKEVKANPAVAQQAMAAMQQGQADANAANQQRYEQLLGSVTGTQSTVTGAGGIFDQMEGLMANMGQTGHARIADMETQNLASNMQSNISRGLGNTTIQNTTERGIRSDAERARQDLDERVALSQAGVKGQRAGAEMDLGRLMADSILSRQDHGPNMDMYAQLLMQMMSR